MPSITFTAPSVFSYLGVVLFLVGLFVVAYGLGIIVSFGKIKLARQKSTKDFGVVLIVLGIIFVSIDLLNFTSNPEAAPTTSLPTTQAKNESAVCIEPPPANPKGDLAEIRFVNTLDTTVNLAFSMISPNIQGECGSYSYVLDGNGATTATILAGCYSAIAFSESGMNAQSAANPICVSRSSNFPEVQITTDRISLR